METKNYSNHTITLQPNWDFTVSGPEFDDSKYHVIFRSFVDAKAEIDRRVAETQKIRAKNVSFSIKVLNEHGELKLIDKINRQNSELTNLDTGHFYPNVDWIREALTRQVKLNQEIQDIGRALNQFRMSKSVGYGRMDAENYAGKVESLRKELTEKTVKAQEHKKLEAVEPTIPQSVA